MKKNTNSPMEQTAKRARAQRPVRRETKEVLTELVEKLRGTLELKATTSASQAEAGRRGELSPNLDRLTVGLDLGDEWSHFCILGLQGETLSEGQVQTREAEVAEFFQALPPARVVMEVGTHSSWMQEVIAGEGHEVVVANPRLMEGRNGVRARMIGSMRRSWRGWNAKKRAAVAVARKLAVLLHRLWVSGEVYEPLGYASSRASYNRPLPSGAGKGFLERFDRRESV